MSNTTLTSRTIVKGDTGIPNSTNRSSASSAPTKPTENEDSAGGKDNEDSQLIPAFSLSNSSTSSSSSVSPSSSITTDTSVASETNIGVLAADKNTSGKYKVEEQVTELNDDGTNTVTMDPNSDADPRPTNTTTVTTASTSTSAPSTPASSSSTSIPLSTPFNSSAPASTSPSTTNVNDLGADANGLTSLLRPRIHQNLNVKFAPLPKLAPRKRKSSTPLGLAARSQLARRRRMMFRDSYDDDDDEMYEESYRPRRLNPPEVPGKEEMEANDGPQGSNTKKKNKSKKTKEGEVERKEEAKEGEQSEDEDPLAALAKKMGRAGKHLWRKMSNGGKAEKGDVGEDGKNLKLEPVPVLGNIANKSDEEQQRVEQGHGSVWMEEVGEQCSLSQEMSGKSSIRIELSLHEASSIPLPPSEPQSPVDVVSTITLRPSSQETLETGIIHEGDSKLDGEPKCLPTTPTIVMSAA